MAGPEQERPFEADQLSMAVEIMQDAVVVFDEHARIVTANARLLAATGYTRAELVGQPALTLVPGALRDELSPRMAAYVKDPVRRSLGEGLESAIARKDGSTFEARLAHTPVRSDQGMLVVVTIRDVEDLSIEEIHFRGLLESTPDATLILDPEGRIVVSNNRAVRLFRRERIEMFDQSVEMLFPHGHASLLLERLRHCHDASLAGTFAHEETPDFELQAIQPDGSVMPVEVSLAPLRTSQGLLLRVAVRDITERQRIRLETDKMKDGFLATVSRELRTPLTSVIGYGELLEDLAPEDLSPLARSFVEVINRNARRELRLVDDLLTMVRIGEGDLSIRPDLLDFRKVVLEAVQGAEPAARQANVLLSFHHDCEGVHVVGDADRLGEALDNLLSNAIKFSPDGADVTIDLRTQPDTVTVAVTDLGLGIAEADMERVFERLYRGENAIKAEKSGIGLGLPIARSIIEAHQGQVNALCTTEQTSFEITLPLARPRALAHAGAGT